ncbi:MAG: fumarylacetoacetase, partial [Acidobacteriaceae bacterium]|nr:fumarylacetoacetase [Acidobacteriaceae bacterium]
MIDETHDPNRKSWVESANVPGCDFPIQNLALGVFRKNGELQTRPGVAIGEYILDAGPWIEGTDLAAFMSMQAIERRDLRREFSRVLESGAPKRDLLHQSQCEMLLPVVIGDYTDFYASLHHATNVGMLFRPDNPLLPNYKHVPIAYHGRSSSIVVSDTPVKRPQGQLGLGDFGPSRELDYEVEIGIFVGPGNALGHPIPIAEAAAQVAGFCLVNDWSARDIQRWEYQPLGPFLAKNFATTISPWVVTADALEPFRTMAVPHDSPVLPYLEESGATAYDIEIQAWLRSARMAAPIRISSGRFRDMYWTPTQMIAHHTSNGCSLRPGDLLASGTISGPEKENRGCLLEMTRKGTEPV